MHPTKKWLPFSFPAIFRKRKQLNPADIIPDPAALPLEWEQKEAIKNTYTSGREYFLFAGDIHPRHQLLMLLKAFSEFKKWQRSDMILLIAGNTTRWLARFKGKLSTYKHKNDVLIIENPEPAILNSLLGAAYAFVYPALEDNYPVHVLNAMQAHVPVITSDIPLIRQIAGDRVLYASANEPDKIAKWLLLLYKDENARSAMIRKAANHA